MILAVHDSGGPRFYWSTRLSVTNPQDCRVFVEITNESRALKATGGNSR